LRNVSVVASSSCVDTGVSLASNCCARFWRVNNQVSGWAGSCVASIGVREGGCRITSTSSRVAGVVVAVIWCITLDVGGRALIRREVTGDTVTFVGGVESRASVNGVIATSVGLNRERRQGHVVANEFLACQRRRTDGSTRAITTARSASTIVVGSAKISNDTLQVVVNVGGRLTSPNAVLYRVEL
jgi:hypothetical protein